MVGGYLVESVLGVGGMGTVYRARHPRLPRYDALKILSGAYATDPLYRARFEREADRAAVIDHPSVVRVYDHGQDRGILWISMQLVNGPNSLELLRERPGGLSLAEITNIAREIGEALDYSHAAGVLHRDVKPGNIFVDRSGERPRYLLGDFGIARSYTDSRLTQLGSVVGTVDYCSPEQLADEPTGPQSDQYAFAATIMHLLTGHRPFGVAGAAIIAQRHLTAELPPASELRLGLPIAVDGVFDRAMSKNMAGRYSSNLAFAAELAASLSTGGESHPIHVSSPAHSVPPPHDLASSRGLSESNDRTQLLNPITHRSPLTRSARKLGIWAIGVIGLVLAVLLAAHRTDGVPANPAPAASTKMINDAGSIDPCSIPASIIQKLTLRPLQRGTAPTPIKDCFSITSEFPWMTVEFAVYPTDSGSAHASAALTRYYDQGQEVGGLPGWRSYTTHSSPGQSSPIYCNVSYINSAAAEIFEIYSLLLPSGSSVDDPDSSLRRSLCDRLPGVAEEINSLIAHVYD